MRTHGAESGDRPEAAQARLALDALPGLVWLCGPDGAVTTLSRGWLEYTGASEADLVGDGWLACVHPQDRPRVDAAWQAAVADQAGFEFVHRLRRRDGAHHWFRARAAPMHDERGILRGFSGLTLDIDDERSHTEDALRQSEARYRSFFENLHEVVNVWEPVCDAHGRPVDWVIRDANRASLSAIGIERAGLLGRRASEVLGSGVEFYLDVFRRVHDSGRPWSGQAALGGREYFSRVFPLEGRRIASTRIDVTARKQAEAALRSSEEQARRQLAEIEALYNTAPVGLCVLDTELRWTRLNERMAQMNGVPVAAHLGRTPREVLPELGEQAEAALRHVLETGEPLLDFEMTGETAAQPGLPRFWNERLLPIKDRAGRVIGISVAAEEITDRRRADQALRESEAKYRGLFENMTDEVHLWRLVRDETGGIRTWRLVDANPPTLRSWGRTLEAVQGRTADEIFGPEVTARYMPVVLQAVSEKRACTFDDYFPLLDKHFRYTTVPLGEHVITTGADVTSIKKAQELAERRRAELEAVYDAMADAVVVFDFSGRAILANEAAARLFGYPSADALKLEAARLPQFYELETPDGRLLALEEWPVARVLRGESVEDVELRARRRDSGREWLLRYSGNPVHAQGRQRLAVVIARDVTQQRRSEEALRESTSLLRTISDASTDAIFAKDRGGRLKFANPATLGRFGRSAASEVLGRTDLELLADRHAAQRVMENDRRIMASGQAAEVEETFPLPDGSSRVWLARKTPFLDEHGRVAGLLGIARDITERKQAEAALRRANEQLRESDRRKDEFLAMLSHELRNPLGPVRNSVYVLGHSAPGSERARHACEVIDRQTQHLARLVDDLLDVTRISRGKVKLQRTSVDLADVVRRTAEDHRETFSAAGVALEVDAPRSLVVDGDPTRLAQVLENLLGNAAKFTPRGGRTTATLVQEGPRAVLRVSDDGAGIAPEMLGLLFEPFVQAEKTLDRSRGGLGLGLALAKGLVEMHGGTIEGESEGVGRGACFTVRLPLQEGTRPAPGAVPSGAAAAARRVLVIEDNRDAAESLREALELSGHRVELAGSGPEGLQKAKAFAPDVVLCDIGLPGMSGFEVARAMRADPGLCSAHLVALSGYAQQEDVQRAREAGFADHMAKPPDLDVLEQLFAALPREY